MSDDIYDWDTPAPQKDYRIEVKVRNNWLLKKIEDAGYENVSQFCKAHKLIHSRVGEFINLKISPINTRGKWSYTFKKIADALRCLPEDICPPQHLRNALKKNKASFEAGIEEVAGFLTGAQEDARPALDKILSEDAEKTLYECMSLLTPREERVIRARFGMTPDGRERTLEETAKELDVTRESVRQIEARSLRKMRLPLSGGISESKRDDLRLAAESIGIHGRRYKKSVDRRYTPEWKKQEDKND